VLWQLQGIIAHTVTSGTGPTAVGAGSLFNAIIDTTTPTFQFTFNTAGIFPYFCLPHFLTGMTGTVIVTVPASVTPNGLGCAGSNGQVLAATATGLPQIGNATFAVNVSGGPAGGQALLFGAIGAQTPPLPVTPACNLYLEINSFFQFLALGLTPIPVPLNAQGSGFFPLPIASTFAPGTRLDLQFAAVDAGVPGGFTTSNALVLIFGI
jgi:hypothetical protein